MSEASVPDRVRRLAIVVSHPIQHFTPFYRALAASPELEIKVFYGSRMGLEPYYDEEMRAEISWRMDLLSGYNSEFLPEAATVLSSAPLAFNHPSLSKALTDYRPDAVLIYGYSHIAAIRALVWCRTHNAAALMIGDSELRRPRGSLLNAAKALALRVLFRHFNAFLAVGDANEAYYRRYGVSDDRLFRSPFTIDEQTFRQARAQRAALRAVFRREYGLSDDAWVALFVGKLSPRKRPADLLQAAIRLNKAAGKTLHCLFAGDGSEGDALHAIAAANPGSATFLGFVNVDRLPSAYCAADLLVHPSQHDPHPLICSEAACIGLPLVLSDRVGAEGPTDIARAGENTVVFPCGDVEALEQALGQILSDPSKLASMGTRSVEIFEELDVRRSVSGAVDAVRYATARRFSA